MKIRDAMNVINEPTFAQAGFMVHFERVEGHMLCGDGFPDKHGGEPLIANESDAWDLAAKFAAKTVGRCVNIYVVRADFVPVDGYRERMIENREA